MPMQCARGVLWAQPAWLHQVALTPSMAAAAQWCLHFSLLSLPDIRAHVEGGPKGPGQSQWGWNRSLLLQPAWPLQLHWHPRSSTAAWRAPGHTYEACVPGLPGVSGRSLCSSFGLSGRHSLLPASQQVWRCTFAAALKATSTAAPDHLPCRLKPSELLVYSLPSHYSAACIPLQLHDLIQLFKILLSYFEHCQYTALRMYVSLPSRCPA